MEPKHLMTQRPFDKPICALRMENSDSPTQISFRVYWFPSEIFEGGKLNIGNHFSAK